MPTHPNVPTCRPCLSPLLLHVAVQKHGPYLSVLESAEVVVQVAEGAPTMTPVSESPVVSVTMLMKAFCLVGVGGALLMALLRHVVYDSRVGE